MLEVILRELKNNNIDEYIITESQLEAVELYFIKKDLEMNRKKKLKEYSVRVFKNFIGNGIEYKGDSTVKIHAFTSEDEMKKIIKDAYFSASFVKNKSYSLPDGFMGVIKEKNNMSKLSLEENAIEVKKSLYKYDNLDKGFINSAEIFVEKNNKRIISSKGADVSFVKYNVSGEFITQWIENQDIEIYNNFSYDSLPGEELSLKVKEALIAANYRDKSSEPLKSGKYNLVLSGDSVIEILNYYIAQSRTSFVYNKYSDFKIGDLLQGEDVKSDKLNLILSSSIPVDDNGTKLVDRVLLEDGKLKTLHGDFKFADYLNVPKTGDYNCASLKGGSVSVDEMFQEGDIHILRFSDFQMNPLTGDFGGEIRLALLKKDNKVIPFTGGSLSANIKKLQSDIILSKEIYNNNSSTTPKAIKFKNVEISGSN
ncbi:MULTISPECIES: metallopeptidase TldD-related protein [Clostridium]|uniref:TldD/PmbA family protein n=1 Tax=Clostridium cibarium TaxID=2762247 RepID=A0ABR8PUN7_9CLOT|nr:MULTISPECIES: metallopeptidase TldD-related protein [Clostridium]MBD7911891.1 TldD/PmbA family protein [Clostridium cibarium]